ncbi:MAG: DUF4384 domain-containing protein [Deltaproteobacteria bacterium]|nr:DUF4384 domain-containing protein [Deltaproteobacteria bacterium]
MTDCPSRLMLASYHTNEMDERQIEMVNSHLKHCARCNEVLNKLRQHATAYESNEAHHLSNLRAAMAAENAANDNVVSIRQSRRGKAAIYAGVAIAAAALLLVMFPVFKPRSQDSEKDMVTYKGDFSMNAVVKRDSNQFVLSEDAALQENDALRFTVQTKSPGFVSIFNVDATGAITLLYPGSDSSQNLPAMKIPRSGETTLDGSVVLDDATGTERFVTVFSTRPFKTDSIRNILKKATNQSIHDSEDIENMLTAQSPEPMADATVRILTIHRK